MFKGYTSFPLFIYVYIFNFFIFFILFVALHRIPYASCGGVSIGRQKLTNSQQLRPEECFLKQNYSIWTVIDTRMKERPRHTNEDWNTRQCPVYWWLFLLGLAHKVMSHTSVSLTCVRHEAALAGGGESSVCYVCFLLPCGDTHTRWMNTNIVHVFGEKKKLDQENFCIITYKQQHLQTVPFLSV